MPDAPVLMVQGARDGLVDPAGIGELLAAVRAPHRSKRIVVPSGHGSGAVETSVDPLIAWLTAHVR
jgi:fermentation-respiration switch protein FrsA (DUF1100 family)